MRKRLEELKGVLMDLVSENDRLAYDAKSVSKEDKIHCKAKAFAYLDAATMVGKILEEKDGEE